MNGIRCVKRARVLGYCMGVRKAVDGVLKALSDYPERTVYTYGPLIHNPVTMQSLAEKGVRILDTEKNAADQIIRFSPVIIRAHGIAPKKRAELEESGALIIDATCPRVIASQRRAAQYAEKGCTVILAGDKNHGEIIGIAGYVQAVPQSRCIVVQNVEEARGIRLGEDETAVLIAQTTIKHSEYEAVAAVLQECSPALRVLDTICPATDERQAALAELAQSVDALIVVGGKNSANTQRLLQTALELGKPAWIAETAADLPPQIFGYGSVGLSAGASAPDSSIDAIEAALVSSP